MTSYSNHLLFCMLAAANLFINIPTPSITANSTPPTNAEPVIAMAPSENTNNDSDSLELV